MDWTMRLLKVLVLLLAVFTLANTSTVCSKGPCPVNKRDSQINDDVEGSDDNQKCLTAENITEHCNLQCSSQQPYDDDILNEMDMNDFLNTMAINETDENNSSRSHDEKSEDRISILLDEDNIFTDCTFVFDTNNETVKAHKAILAFASPVLKDMMQSHGDKGHGLIRVSNISANTFKTLLRFVYTDEVCFKSYDEACELMEIATKLKLSKLASNCRSYLWTSLYPDNVWGAYTCAARVNDNLLKDTALQLAQEKASNILKDKAFTKIPYDALISFLSRDTLNVDSEVHLYQATIRWAIAEVERQNLLQNSKNLRDVLGEAILHIRFLQFNLNEFSSIQSATNILSYSESIAVSFNLMSPGIMPLPKTLSHNSNSRSASDKTFSFDVFTTSNTICREPAVPSLAKGENTFDALSTSIIKNTANNIRVKSINIPMQMSDYCNFTEDLTVYILKTENNKTKIVSEIPFTGTPASCLNRNTWNSRQIGSKLINVVLSKEVDIPIATPEVQYKVKVVFHKPGRYLSSLGTKESSKVGLQSENNNEYVWYFGEKEFIYSLDVTTDTQPTVSQ